MLAGHVKGDKTSLSSMFEAVGAHAAGKITDEDLCEFESKACPTCGSCSGMYTAKQHELSDRGAGNGDSEETGPFLRYILQESSSQSMPECRLGNL